MGMAPARACIAICGCLAALLSGGAVGAEFRTIAVSTAPDAQEFPSAVLKEDGTLYVLWHDTRLGDRDIFGQRYAPDGSASWDADGKPLVVGELEQGWVQAVDDGSDGFAIVWGHGRPDGRALYAQRFDALATRQWQRGGAGASVVSSGKDDHKMVGDGHGGYHIVWEDWRVDNLDIYGQWIDADGKARWHADGLAVSDLPGHQYDPAVAASPDGPLVTWWSVEGPAWRVYAQRIARDGRRLWGRDGALGTLVDANQSSPVIASDGAGGAFLAWADSRDDDGTFSNLDVYAQHFGPDGARGWGDSGRVICEAQGTQQQIFAIADGLGGVYLAWTDARDVFDDIYMQHVQADGSFAWPAWGLPVCVEDGRQRSPQLAMAGGHVWIAWLDYRRETMDETPEDVYIQRVSPDGSFLYADGGLALETEPGSRGSLALTATGSHVAVTWMDVLMDGSDIYAAVRQVAEN